MLNSVLYWAFKFPNKCFHPGSAPKTNFRIQNGVKYESIIGNVEWHGTYCSGKAVQIRGLKCSIGNAKTVTFGEIQVAKFASQGCKLLTAG